MNSASVRSHPPLRRPPQGPERPLGPGPNYFVDPERGRDEGPGSASAPWRTVAAAVPRLKPGDTLVLRGGVYYENVYCAAVGLPEAPITLRGYPGESAVLDGSIPAFQIRPEDCWAEAPGGAAGEFRSARPYPNIRDVVGSFGDSMVGLQTYWHRADLVAENEFWDPGESIYCGPGIWYDKRTGFIHCRLAHTDIGIARVADYRGETDPRNLPLVVSPLRSCPLMLDQAMHIRLQDLVIRGGGYNSLVMLQACDVALDNVTIWAATYGIRTKGTGPLRMADSAIHGNIPPWGFRDENSLNCCGARHCDPYAPPPPGVTGTLRPYIYHGPVARNVCRLNTHAVLAADGYYEFEVFARPLNHDWEICRCEFTDGHDGVYLCGHGLRFHHNYVNGFQDDAIYVSAMSPYCNDDVHVFQNVISRSGLGLGTHTRGGPFGQTFVYRNIVDLRCKIPWNRPSRTLEHEPLQSRVAFCMHGHELLGVEDIFFYQNTILSRPNRFAGNLLIRNRPERTRAAWNNILLYLDHYPSNDFEPLATGDVRSDGNLHWCPAPGAEPPPGYLDAVRRFPKTPEAAAHGGEPWEARSLVAEPGFSRYSNDPDAPNDYRLRPASPAAGAGVALPDSLPEVCPPRDGARPDIGALPLGGEPFRVGRFSRYSAEEAVGQPDARLADSR